MAAVPYHVLSSSLLNLDVTPQFLRVGRSGGEIGQKLRGEKKKFQRAGRNAKKQERKTHLRRRLINDANPVNALKERVGSEGGKTSHPGTQSLCGVKNQELLHQIPCQGGKAIGELVVHLGDLLKSLVLIGTLEGRPASKELVNNAPKGPQVRPLERVTQKNQQRHRAQR